MNSRDAQRLYFHLILGLLKSDLRSALYNGAIAVVKKG